MCDWKIEKYVEKIVLLSVKKTRKQYKMLFNSDRF